MKIKMIKYLKQKNTNKQIFIYLIRWFVMVSSDCLRTVFPDMYVEYGSGGTDSVNECVIINKELPHMI